MCIGKMIGAVRKDRTEEKWTGKEWQLKERSRDKEEEMKDREGICGEAKEGKSLY